MLSFGISIHSIIRKGNKILVTKRPPTAKFGANQWDVPGGALELTEQPEEGLLREINEETGLCVKIVKPLSVFSKIVQEKEKHILYLTYLSDYQSGEVKLSAEHVEYRWVNVEDAFKLALVDYLAKTLLDMDKTTPAKIFQALF